VSEGGHLVLLALVEPKIVYVEGTNITSKQAYCSLKMSALVVSSAKLIREYNDLFVFPCNWSECSIKLLVNAFNG
jgi:hypothetical protein